MTLHDLERALIAAATAYLKEILAEALASGTAPRAKRLPPTKPAAKPAPLAPSKPSGLPYHVPFKRCVTCKKTFQGRGNRQIRCYACGGGKSKKRLATAGATSPPSSTRPARRPTTARGEKPGPGRPRTWKRPARAKAAVPVRHVLRPKPPAPEDPKKAEFQRWMQHEKRKREATAKKIVDRALAGIGGDVEDVPLAAAIERHP